MITSFFSKSNPIQGIVLAGILTTLVLLQYGSAWSSIYTLHILTLLGILFQHHRIAQLFPFAHHNVYLEAFTVLFFVLNPHSIASISALGAYFIFLFSAREFLSLDTSERSFQKVFNSGFWIGVAAVIYFPSILAVLVFFLAMVFFEIRSMRLWLLALIGLITPFFFYYSTVFLLDQPSNLLDHNHWVSASVKAILFSKETGLFMILLIACFRYFFSGIVQNNKEKKGRFIVVFSCFIFGIPGILCAPLDYHGFLFLAFPFSIVMTFNLTSIHRKWVKELLFLAFLTGAASQLFFG